jgi:hypothetical protein
VNDPCPCHGVPWYVRPNGERQCRVKKREASRRYNASEEGREAHRRYVASEKGQETQRRYNASEEGREAQRRYKGTPKGWARALRERRTRALARIERAGAVLQAPNKQAFP